MCTGISFKSVEGKSFLGRTQEYNIPYDYIGVQFPENFEVSGIVEPWNTVYSVLGVGIQNQNSVAHGVVDGVNEHGLGGITQYFSEFNNYSSVEKITEAGKLPILAEQFIFWVLANCKDTGEVEEKILEVAIADSSLSGQSPGLPQHFMFTDTTGRRIVVEPTKELGFEVYENTIGVMTNSPKFDWHVTNLENYTGLSDTNVKDAVFNDYKVLSAGKGSGLHGIPGDSTAVSRFVRASYLLKYSDTVPSKDSVNKAFHILATSDIVKGVIKLDLPEDRNRQYTQYTSVYDLSKKQLYIKMYENFTIQMIEFDDTVANQDKTKVYELVKVPKYKVLNDK